MMEKMGKLGIFRPNFIMAINLPKIKAWPPLKPLCSLFVVLIHITVRLAALFDCLGEETWSNCRCTTRWRLWPLTLLLKLLLVWLTGVSLLSLTASRMLLGKDISIKTKKRDKMWFRKQRLYQEYSATRVLLSSKAHILSKTMTQ